MWVTAETVLVQRWFGIFSPLRGEHPECCQPNPVISEHSHLGISTSWCRNCFPQRLLGPSGAALIFPTSGFSWAVVAAPAWCSNSSHQARCRSDTDKRSVLSLQASLYFSSHLPAPSPPCINLHVLDFNSFWYSKIFVCSHFSLSSALQQLFRGCHWQLS